MGIWGNMTVCDKCFRRECWEGEFMCDEAGTAGTVEVVDIDELVYHFYGSGGACFVVSDEGKIIAKTTQKGTRA